MVGLGLLGVKYAVWARIEIALPQHYRGLSCGKDTQTCRLGAWGQAVRPVQAQARPATPWGED